MTPAANGHTPAGVWSHGTARDVATPGVFGGDHQEDSTDGMFELACACRISLISIPGVPDLADGWLFDSAFAKYITRFLVEIEGTRPEQYLDGEYEGKTGRILAAQENPQVYEQTARVRFENGENRSIPTKYIVRRLPTFIGQEVLVLRGNKKGQPLVVREDPSDDEKFLTLSTKAQPTVVDKWSTKTVILLHDDANGS